MDYTDANSRKSAAVVDLIDAQTAATAAAHVIVQFADSISLMTDAPRAIRDTAIRVHDRVRETNPQTDMIYNQLHDAWRELKSILEAAPEFLRDWQLHYTAEPDGPPTYMGTVLSMDAPDHRLAAFRAELDRLGLPLTGLDAAATGYTGEPSEVLPVPRPPPDPATENDWGPYVLSPP